MGIPPQPNPLADAHCPRCTTPCSHCNGMSFLDIMRRGETDLVLLERFTEDMNYVFHAAEMCSLHHRNHHKLRTGTFCDECVRDLRKVINVRQAVGGAPKEFIMTEEEMRGLLRQLHRHHITWEGTSGPVVHAFLARIKKHLTPEQYAEFLINA